MPRYFFDVAGDLAQADETGLHLPSSAEARVAAIRFLGELLVHEPQKLFDGNVQVVVRTDDGPPMAIAAARLEPGAI